MRPRIGIGLVALAAAAAAGCGGSGGSAQKREATTTTGGGSAVKVGLVTDINQLNDRGFNHLAYTGLLRAEHRLGVKGVVFQSPSRADYIPNLAALARQHYDLVIGVGFDQAEAVDTVATRFPQ